MPPPAGRLFLEPTDPAIVVGNPLNIYGSSGSTDSIQIINGTTNIVCDQNVERLSLPQASSTFTFEQAGNQLKVYFSTSLMATLPLQGDNDGTLVEFSDGIYSAKLANTGLMTIGNATVPTGVPGSINVAGTPTNLLSQAQEKSVTNSTYGTLATSSTEYINTLDGKSPWQKGSLTYSFNSSIPGEYTANASLTSGWRALNTVEKEAVHQVVASINKLLGVQLSVVSSNGDLRFNTVNQASGIAGFAYSPADGLGGDVFLDQSAGTASYQMGSDDYFTVVHEIGHAMGLKHPFEGSPVLPTNLDDSVHSVMSYTEFRGREFVATWNASTNRVSAINAMTQTQSDFSLFDVHALQSIYGANTSHNTGDNTYTAIPGRYQTLWDAGGKDIIDLSSTTGAARIDLRPGTLSSANIKTLDDLIADALADLAAQGAPSATWLTDWVTTSVTQYEPDLYNGSNNLAIPLGVLIEEVKTGSNHDEVRDNAVDNRISTGTGDDTIRLGEGGFDFIDAGLGSDKVVFSIASTAVQREAQADGSMIVLATNFAAQLVGVETLVFSDQQISI